MKHFYISVILILSVNLNAQLLPSARLWGNTKVHITATDTNGMISFGQFKTAVNYFNQDALGIYYMSSAIERLRLYDDGRVMVGGITNRYSKFNVLGGINTDSLYVNSYLNLTATLPISITPDYILNINSSTGVVTRVQTKNLKISQTANDVITANNAASMTIDFNSELMYTIPFDFSFVSSDVNTTINANNLREGGEYTLWYKGSLFKTFTFSSTSFKNPDGSGVPTCSGCAARIYNFKVIGGVAYLKN